MMMTAAPFRALLLSASNAASWRTCIAVIGARPAIQLPSFTTAATDQIIGPASIPAACRDAVHQNVPGASPGISMKISGVRPQAADLQRRTRKLRQLAFSPMRRTSASPLHMAMGRQSLRRPGSVGMRM